MTPTGIETGTQPPRSGQSPASGTGSPAAGQSASQAGIAGERGDTGRATDQLSQTFDDFLRLLTTQLKNQDPISPMDANEFTNQLVSFSQVEQQIATNEKLDELIGANSAGGFGGALGYLGQEVEVIGSNFNYDGDPVTLGYGMPTDAVVGILEIRNAAGGVVHVQEAASQAGRNEFTWDGRGANGEPVPPGPYSIKVRATDVEGEPVEVPTFVRGRVDGVENVDGENVLLMGETPVSLDDVLAIRAPDEETDES
jgi:flagellar basal-body rod modification protein FlgD